MDTLFKILLILRKMRDYIAVANFRIWSQVGLTFFLCKPSSVMYKMRVVRDASVRGKLESIKETSLHSVHPMTEGTRNSLPRSPWRDYVVPTERLDPLAVLWTQAFLLCSMLANINCQ